MNQKTDSVVEFKKKKDPMDTESSAKNHSTSAPEGSDPETDSNLLKKVVSLTGLPSDLVQRELSGILENAGHSGEELTLEDLRAVMVAYLDSIQEDMIASQDS